MAVAPGEGAVATIRVPAGAFAHWDGEWPAEPGAFTVRAGGSVTSLPLTRTVELRS